MQYDCRIAKHTVGGTPSYWLLSGMIRLYHVFGDLFELELNLCAKSTDFYLIFVLKRLEDFTERFFID